MDHKTHDEDALLEVGLESGLGGQLIWALVVVIAVGSICATIAFAFWLGHKEEVKRIEDSAAGYYDENVQLRRGIVRATEMLQIVRDEMKGHMDSHSEHVILQQGYGGPRTWTKSRNGNWSTWTMNPDGSGWEPREVTDFDLLRQNLDGSWNPLFEFTRSAGGR